MRYGLLRLGEIVPHDHLDEGEMSFVEYVSDRKKHVMSNFDGGQMSFSFLIGDKTMLWNAHLGAYQGILQNLTPKPGKIFPCYLTESHTNLADVLIQAIAGRANIDGRPFDGSAAEAATSISRWLGEPSKVIWCLHDESPIKPWRIKTDAAKELVESKTKSRVTDLQPVKVYNLFG